MGQRNMGNKNIKILVLVMFSQKFSQMNLLSYQNFWQK